MNYFELYPGDYLRDTSRLSLLEHGAYFRLLLAYYGEGVPFADDLAELYVAAGAANSAEKSAVKKVADKYFPVAEDGLRHNKRADDVIAQAHSRMGDPVAKKSSQADRAKRYRERRSDMFKLLRDNSVVLDFNSSAEDLEAAVMALASRKSSRDERDGTRDERDASRVICTASRPQTPDPIEKQKQKQSTNVDSSTAAGDAVADDAGDGSDHDHGEAGGGLLGDQQHGMAMRSVMPPCPHNEIIALYHELLPSLRQVRTWEGKRPKHLQARWREDPERQNLGWWRRFFGYVAKSDFLMGRKTDFAADLEWLIAPGNFAKVIEGKYENARRGNA